MLRATKVRIYPTPEQVEHLDRQFGAVRFVYNRALAIKSHRYKAHGQSLSGMTLKKLLAPAKRSRRYSWLSDFDSKSLQQACLTLDKAFKNFFEGRARYPRFKRKHGAQSSYHCENLKVGDDWIKIPEMQPIKAKVHREVEGKIKSITLSRTQTGKYFASILHDDGKEAKPQPKKVEAGKVVGVDLGLSHLAILSDGEKIENPRFLRNAQCNLRRKQKALSRKKKGSKNRGKARLQVAKAHERVANARNDFQHKLSRKLVDENQAVIVETLRVKNMMKNRRLSRSIGDAAWCSLVSKIEYKATQVGVHFVRIGQWEATSKTCSCCGHKVEAMPLNVRDWQCPECDTTHDRDVNAAVNVRRIGITELMAGGCAVTVSGGLCKSESVSGDAAANEGETLAA